MTASTSLLHRSYRIGTSPEIPNELYGDLDEKIHRYARFTLSGLINNIFGNYIENQSRIVRSICDQFGKVIPEYSPSPDLHYGNYRNITKTSANIADSAHAYLSWSYCQFLTQIEKFRDFISYISNPNFKNVSHGWLVSGFIPRWVAKRLASRWRIKDWTWVKNTARGWRNTIEKHSFWPVTIGLRKNLNNFSSHEWIQAGFTLLDEFDALISQRALQGYSVQNLTALWRKIARILRSGLNYLNNVKINGLSSNQKNIATELQNYCGKGNYRSALGLLYSKIIIQKFGISQVSELLDQLNTNAEKLLTPPFSSEHSKNKLPAIILTSPKYILTRLNGKNMTAAIQSDEQVFFTLPRRPKTAVSLLSSYQHLLTPMHQERLRDEFPKLPDKKKIETTNRGSSSEDRNFRAFLRRLLGLRLKRWLGIKTTLKEQIWIKKFDISWQEPLKSQKLQLKLKLHKKIVEKIKKGSEINQILVHPPQTAAKHTTTVLQLRGNATNLISYPKTIDKPIQNSLVHVLGYDLNRLSDQAVTFGALDINKTEIPLRSVYSSKSKTISRINLSLKSCDSNVAGIQQALHRYGDDLKRTRKLSSELRLLHRRRQNLKKEAELLIAQEIYSKIHYYNPEIVAFENLKGLSTRGKRGKLAKIINYMCKRSDALAMRIEDWYSVQSQSPLLKSVDPRYTSKIHFNCGGTIQRTIQNWDRAPCNRCAKMVNTQLNAPLRIAEKAFSP